MLEIHDLQKSFGDLHVLRGIDLNIQKGDVVAVLGSSGSGKTTLLRCMNFLEHADAGTMVFDGQQVELSRITHAQIHALRRRTGFVPKLQPVRQQDRAAKRDRGPCHCPQDGQAPGRRDRPCRAG